MKSRLFNHDTSNHRGPRRLQVQGLEQRSLMAADLNFSNALSAPPGPQVETALVATTERTDMVRPIPRPTGDDRFENNDTMEQATRLGSINSAVTYSDLRMRDSADFYSFRLDGQPAAGANITLNFQHAQGDVDVHLYNSAGQLLRSSTGVGNSERISLDGLAAGQYVVKVYGFLGAHNPNYSMTIDPRQGADDRFENNDTMEQATRLGTITSAVTYSDLRMRDSADFYQFRLSGEPTVGANITLNFQHRQGDVDIHLYNSAGQLIRSSTGTGNSERISLDGLAAGQYVVKVYGYNGAHNPNYSMTIDPRQSADDRFENNDTMAQATRLGTITSAVTYSDLRMRDAADFYSLRLLGSGGTITVDFQHRQGDVDVHVYNTAGQLVGSSTGTGNSERIALPAGEYVVKVYGYNGAHNPNYSMTVTPGRTTRPRAVLAAVDSVFDEIGSTERPRRLI